MTFLSERPVVIAILCEGETEETFVKSIMKKHLASPQKILKPIKLGGTARRGYKKLEHEVRYWLQDRSTSYVTTMIDLYGIPKDFPGMVQYHSKSHRKAPPYKKVKFLEETWAENIGDDRFIPHLMLHEFEALLLVPSALEKLKQRFKTRDNDKTWRKLLRELDHKKPEEINENKDGHPSAIIKKIWPEYNKTIDGISILEGIPINELLEYCPHFGSWIKKLESLQM